MFLSDGNQVFFPYIILFRFSKFISSSCVSVCFMWFGYVVFRLLLVCGLFRLECSCFSMFTESVIILVFCFDSIFVFWRISCISRSENQPFFIIVLTWSASFWFVIWNLMHSSQISIILFQYPPCVGLLLNNSEEQVFLSSLVHILCWRP